MDKISFEVGGHCGGDENKNDDAETTNRMQKKHKNINNIVMVINKSFIVILNEEGNHMGASVAREE